MEEIPFNTLAMARIDITVSLSEIIDLIDQEQSVHERGFIKDSYASYLLKACPELLQQKLPSLHQYANALSALIEKVPVSPLLKSICERFISQSPLLDDEQILKHLRSRPSGYVFGCQKKKCSTCLVLLRRVPLTPCNHAGTACFGGKGVHLKPKTLNNYHLTGDLDVPKTIEKQAHQPLASISKPEQVAPSKHDNETQVDLAPMEVEVKKVSDFCRNPVPPVEPGQEDWRPSPTRLAHILKYDARLQRYLGELLNIAQSDSRFRNHLTIYSNALQGRKMPAASKVKRKRTTWLYTPWNDDPNQLADLV